MASCVRVRRAASNRREGSAMRIDHLIAASAILLVLGSCASPGQDTAQTSAHGAHAQSADGGRPVLYTTLGSYSYRITMNSAEAQRWFDQGLRLAYGFNHLEAQRAFREAARLDPGCAMCFWGIAITEGSNYNDPTNADREKKAATAAHEALRLSAGAKPPERAMIQALAKRHSTDPAAKRATLERVIAKNPNHPGALHLYIHAVEASREPGRAEAAADRLRPLMPGAGHLVHMPSHIYWRIGRYADAVTVNTVAADADRAYFKTATPSPIYRGLYYPHNIDFIWQSAAMQGRSAETIRAAREFASNAPAEMIKQMPDMETAPVAPIVALVRFGRWDEVLANPAPPREWPYTSGVWHYARGMAFNAKGQTDTAAGELSALEAILQSVPPDRTVAFFFRSKNMLQLAANLLAGEIAAKAGDFPTAERLLRAAVAEQDSHWFTEPPPWYFPVRQSLGAVLLQAGRPGDAEQVYREDLRRNPGNGWSLFGLAQSLRAQGKTAEAAQVDERFVKAWAQADVKLTASRF